MEQALAKAVQIFLALTAGYLVASWFVLAVWAYRDIGTRSKSVVTQILGTLLVVLFWIPGALLYLLLRPKDTIDDVFQRSLEEEYLIHDLEEVPVCHACQRPVEDEYVVCPHCQAELKEACPICTRLISLQWDVCPYCASTRDERAAIVREQIPAAEERYIDAGERTIRQLPGRQQIRPVASGQPEAIPPGIGTPSLDAGEAPAAADNEPETATEESIRLFDRKRTRMRNEQADRTVVESPDSQNGAGPDNNGHHADAGETRDENDAGDSSQSEDPASGESPDANDTAAESETAPVSQS